VIFAGLDVHAAQTSAARELGIDLRVVTPGPSHARRLLVEAAQHYRRPPRLGVGLERRQAGQDPRVCAVAWRAQQRLYHQWQRLHTDRRKPFGVVVVACGRQLSALWEAATIT
jgi:hypothetical protein